MKHALRPYGDKYRPAFGLDDNGNTHNVRTFVSPLFGFELELETRKFIMNEAAARFVMGSWSGESVSLTCGKESSLEHGFEVVSKPATLGFLLNKMDWSFLRRAKLVGARIGTNVGEHGFHIHVSRTAFTDDEHINRFRSAVIAQVLQPDADKISWFTKTVYCRPIVDDDDRFTAVNVTGMSTVEVRCFVPTFSALTVKRYLRYLARTIINTQGGK